MIITTDISYNHSIPRAHYGIIWNLNVYMTARSSQRGIRFFGYRVWWMAQACETSIFSSPLARAKRKILRLMWIMFYGESFKACNGCGMFNSQHIVSFRSLSCWAQFYVNGSLHSLTFHLQIQSTHDTQKRRKYIQLVHEVRKELNNSRWQRQQNKKHSGTRLYIFISTSYIALFFFIVNEAMKTFRRCCYMAQKKETVCRYIYCMTIWTKHTFCSLFSGVRTSHGLNKPYVYVK